MTKLTGEFRGFGKRVRFDSDLALTVGETVSAEVHTSRGEMTLVSVEIEGKRADGRYWGQVKNARTDRAPEIGMSAKK